MSLNMKRSAHRIKFVSESLVMLRDAQVICQTAKQCWMSKCSLAFKWVNVAETWWGIRVCCLGFPADRFNMMRYRCTLKDLHLLKACLFASYGVFYTVHCIVFNGLCFTFIHHSWVTSFGKYFFSFYFPCNTMYKTTPCI